MFGMRNALVLSVAMATAILAAPIVSAGSSSTDTRLAATLDARHVVTPANKPWKPPASVAKAHGSFAATLGGAKGRLLQWRITYAGVGASPLQIADVHYGAPGHFGPILFRLCGPCKSGQSGTKTISAADLRSIKAGTSWVTVITGKYPNGVIRGQIKVL